MNVIFGHRDDFAIEAGIDGAGSVSSTVWGHMCIWCRGAALGDIDNTYCSIGSAQDRLRSLVTPVRGQLRIDCLWAHAFVDLNDNAILNFLDRMLYGYDDDGKCSVDKSLHEVPCDSVTWWDFDFLTNWGEQFDGYKSFIVRPPGESVRILSRALPTSMGRAVDISRDTFVAAVESFCTWLDEVERERASEFASATSHWSPPSDGVPWFPDEALAHLRAARFKETAFPLLEVTSRSLVWSDEAYLEFVAVCNGLGSPWGLAPLSYRSSLILGQPSKASKRAWDELKRLCPQWPGFRAERSSPKLRDEFERPTLRCQAE